MTEKEKMLAGQLYQAGDPELLEERLRARKLLHQLNHSEPDDSGFRKEVLNQLFGKVGANFWVEPPFFCDYGSNISVGDDVFFNFNCVILDVVSVSFGDRVLVAPNVQFYPATHPLDPKTRGELWEYGKEIHVGSDVWIGGGSIICPGVKIGNRSIIGAGSVVTKDVPEGVIVAGNPAKIIRQLEK